MKRRWIQFLAITILAKLATTTAGIAFAENLEATVGRLSSHLEYLAGDELEGRGVATEGNHKAAEYLKSEFLAAGLKGALPNGQFYQSFPIHLSEEIVTENTSVELIGPDDEKRTLEIGTDFQPLLIGRSGEVKAPLVFAGYGISAPKLNYDDYADLDVKDKIVIVLRKEPQQANADSVFDGARISPHAYIRTKIKIASDHGAAGLILVNDPSSAKEKDELTKPEGFGNGTVTLPFVQITQAVFEKLLETSPVTSSEGKPLKTIPEIVVDIDENFAPVSTELEGWSADVAVATKQDTVEVSNVIGLLKGDGSHGDETIVVGAHFDHLGYGGFGSRNPSVRAIHNGADDNASGTSALIELARRFGQRNTAPSRDILFIAFNGEERGLLGSNYYLAHPVVPLEDTVAMLNLDMVGRKEGKPLTVYGVGTSKEMKELVETLAEKSSFEIKSVAGVIGASDHFGFYLKKIPALHLFTGTTKEYHTPEDDLETLDINGIAEVVDFAEGILDQFLSADKPMEFVEVATQKSGRPGKMAHLGVIPDYSGGVIGLKLNGVSPDTPAEQAGLKADDIIVKFGDIPVTDIHGLVAGLQKYKPNEDVDLVVLRDDTEVTVRVRLGESKGHQ
ncbi:M28 family peptidase [Calycomorphotria hydatis]|uniref:Aminopeptidase YwaD n=1 Tax=Calycomorphotria hydatis TaxID=2528027 RepID=A0A517T917_9PLAN|nr:M28 family peptidase [Calycomorphotria hydatis]QDT64849.1 Aminopeptidase YwaD precursor [Calycomorphotria hydatis]